MRWKQNLLNTNFCSCMFCLHVDYVVKEIKLGQTLEEEVIFYYSLINYCIKLKRTIGERLLQMLPKYPGESQLLRAGHHFIAHRQDPIIYRRQSPHMEPQGVESMERLGNQNQLHWQWGKGKLHRVFLCGEQTKTTLISLSRMTLQDFVIFNSKLSSAVWCRGSRWRVKEWVISLRNTPVYTKPPAHPTASPSSNLGRSGLTLAHLKLLVS